MHFYIHVYPYTLDIHDTRIRMRVSVYMYVTYILINTINSYANQIKNK